MIKLNNKDITPRNEKGEAHGLWTVYHGGRLAYIGNWVNDKRFGLWERYKYNNELDSKTYYII